MVEIAEEFVESVLGGQIFVPVAKVVLAELSRRISKWLERLSNGDIATLQADRSAGRTDLAQAGSQANLTRNECRASCCAAVLRIVVREQHPFLGDAIDVWSPITHHPVGVGRDVGLADIVAEDDENVRRGGFLRIGRSGADGGGQRDCAGGGNAGKQYRSPSALYRRDRLSDRRSKDTWSIWHTFNSRGFVVVWAVRTDRQSHGDLIAPIAGTV
jgi:hypothetical protein